MRLSDIPIGQHVHNIELQPGRGAQMCRSAGSYAQLQAREGSHAVILLPSGELRRIHVKCRATIGRVGNTDHQNVKLGKAGRKRHMGRRPKVRGTAMNPVDHPLGGGEGRTKGGRHPCSPTAVLAKGGRTRARKNPSDKFILRRRKKKR
jgi:large subunit ribosomal protein L2